MHYSRTSLVDQNRDRPNTGLTISLQGGIKQLKNGYLSTIRQVVFKTKIMDNDKIDLFEPIGGKGSLPINPVKVDKFTFMGLTKREHFAAMAMQSMLPATFSQNGFQRGTAEGLADYPVKLADALIKALNK